MFAWELGEGLGHLPALKAIARAVKAEGATPVFALRDAVLTRAMLSDIHAQILPAPFWPTPALPQTPTGAYTDILIGNGYSSAESIRALVSAWDQVINLVKPDLVICEHAPSAALTAFGRIPAALVGNGFVVPPADGAEFPPYQASKREAAPQAPVLKAIQRALGDLGRPAPAALCEPFRGVFRSVFSFPELDTYRHARREAVLGPIEPLPPLTPLPDKPRLFAYSSAQYPFADELALALMELGPQASAFFRGAMGARSGVMRSRGLKVYDEPPALSEALADATAVFSHGGSGTTNAAFAAGRPQIVFPRHFEAQATARALEELGAGVHLRTLDAKRLRNAVRQVNEDPKMRDAAQRAGAAAQRFVAQAKALETTVAALRKALS